MTGLSGRLDAAVRARLEVARAAGGRRETPPPAGGEHWRWECSSCDTAVEITPITVLDEVLECPSCGGWAVCIRSVEQYPTGWGGSLPHMVTHGTEEVRPVDAKHIIDNASPARVIRDCERDLRVLERHKPITAPAGGPWVDARGEQSCERCDETAVWPCDDIAWLAEAYGVEVEEAPLTKRELRPATHDNRTRACAQCGVETPDSMQAMCCGVPMCFNCLDAHGVCEQAVDG